MRQVHCLRVQQAADTPPVDASRQVARRYHAGRLQVVDGRAAAALAVLMASRRCLAAPECRATALAHCLTSPFVSKVLVPQQQFWSLAVGVDDAWD
jgi:hypothetical protein